MALIVLIWIESLAQLTVAWLLSGLLASLSVIVLTVKASSSKGGKDKF